ncbi:unnamed protein product [Adineta steineri]|uniref:Uncharacterized protein n=1 Tax=Adineta steineri TaxID=433720 RepID=A0A814P6W1_9BILA|nr:unnamed protein product [Adineta steineri]CAF1141808.1 unnamed protein product [Adineta steineri]CAF3483471.1 unnamed protein product [Adineta steineri]CAF3527869.1 unnamed protein product [Adineta steineri]
MVKIYSFFLVLLFSILSFETVNASFQIKIIRAVIKKAETYAAATMGEGLAGNTVAKVLKDVDKILGPLGLNYWVTMEQFSDAAVRVGLTRQIGIAVYHVVDFFAPIGKK